LRTMNVSMIINMGAYGILGALDIFFVTENLHVSAHLYGFLGAAAGGGSIVGAFLANHLVKRLGQIKTSWMAMVAMGILILIFARQTSFFPSLGLFALFGGANAISIVAMEPLTLQATPRILLGRVSSVIVTSWTLTLIIATALAGYLASTVFNHFHRVFLGIPFHSVDTLFTGAGILLIVSGIYFRSNLRGVTLSKETKVFIETIQELETENKNKTAER
jgi:MFS family permease